MCLEVDRGVQGFLSDVCDVLVWVDRLKDRQTDRLAFELLVTAIDEVKLVRGQSFCVEVAADLALCRFHLKSHNAGG